MVVLVNVSLRGLDDGRDSGALTEDTASWVCVGVCVCVGVRVQMLEGGLA